MSGINNTGLGGTQPVSGTVAVSSVSGTVAISGSVTVSGTVAATQSGTWTFAQSPFATTGNAPAQVSIGTSSTTVLPSNASRTGCNIVNMSFATISLAFGSNAAVSYFGIVLGPGGSFWMDGNDFTTAAINAISDGSAASAYLAVQEWQ